MNAFEKILAEIRNVKFHKIYNSLIKNEDIKKFDDSFYSRFEGMYFNGLPIYYYLQVMNMGKCYDTSAILSLALDNDNYVCRGELQTMSKIYGEMFHHGWVEDDKYVYDTTWQIICLKEVYYKLFKVRNSSKTNCKKFFEDCKDISNWRICVKEDYEKEHTFETTLIYFVKSLELKKLEDKNISKEQREFCLKILNDLPKIDHLKPHTIEQLIRKENIHR